MTAFFRLWCGQKRHSHWLSSRDKLIRVAVSKGLAFDDGAGTVSLGPLTWIEHGERARPKSRTVSLGHGGPSGPRPKPAKSCPTSSRAARP